MGIPGLANIRIRLVLPVLATCLVGTGCSGTHALWWNAIPWAHHELDDDADGLRDVFEADVVACVTDARNQVRPPPKDASDEESFRAYLQERHAFNSCMFDHGWYQLEQPPDHPPPGDVPGRIP